MRVSFICILIIFSKAGLTGQNLVPNPSFEDTISCPTGLIQLYKAVGWTINVNSADYFHTCASANSHVSVPSAFGFQYPHSGDAFAGFIGKYSDYFAEAREYLGRELSSPLIPGHRYYVSFYVSLNELSCGINKIGILFTNNFLGDTVILPPPLINNFAHVYTDSIVSDTSSWTKISGSFIADSVYRYFMIGNFFDNAHIDSLLIPDSIYTTCGNYYYVDDVCVSADPLTCDVIPTSIEPPIRTQIRIYPSPATDNLTIENVKQETTFHLYDLLGKEVLATKLLTGKNQIEIKNLTNGIYIYRVIGESKVGKVFIEK